MTKAVLHIGTSKTGTSFLQTTLSASRDALAAIGFVYPALGKRKNHTKLSLSFNTLHSQRHRIFNVSVGEQSRAWLTTRLTDLLAAESERGGNTDATWIFSTENASRLQDEDAAELVAFLREFFDDVSVIVYLRRREFLLASRYSQRRKAGRGADFTWDDLIDILVREAPETLVNRWQRVVGPDHLIVRPYFEDFKRSSESLLADFCEQLGIDRTVLNVSGGGPALRNTSLSGEGVEFLRDLNDLMPTDTIEGKPNIKLRRRILARVQEITAGPPLTIPPTVLSTARQKFRSSDASLVADLGDTTEWTRWLDQTVDPSEAAATHPMTPQRTIELMLDLSLPAGPVDYTEPDWRPAPKPKAKPTTDQRIRRKVSRTLKGIRN